MKGRYFRKCAFLALVLGMALLCGAAMAQSVSTADELAEAVKAAKGGDVITLTADIRSNRPEEPLLVNTRGKEIVIDLGGHEFTYPYFGQGTFTVRNGSLVGASLNGNGKALTVNLAENVRCSGDDYAVGINDKNGGKITFSNAGSLEGDFGIRIVQDNKAAIQIANTGTVTADACALWIVSASGKGSFKVVNDGLMESRYCAAIRFQDQVEKTTLSIEGSGELVGACGISVGGNTAVTADQRITATYTSEKSDVVLEWETWMRSIYQNQHSKIMGMPIKEGDPLYEEMQAFASLRSEEENGVAVAIRNGNGDTNSLRLSGTLSATNRLLLLPGVLPYGSKAKVEVHATVAPNSQADFFDIWLALEKRPKEFTEAVAEKQLKAGMKRLDVEDFLASGGRLRVCVSAPVLNAEGKMLISLSRNVLIQECKGGYLSADGMEWVDGVAEEIYNQGSSVLTDREELIDAFKDAIAAEGKYAVYLDCDVIVENSDTGAQSRFHAFRPKKGGMLYVEGNGHILQNGILSLDSPATLRNLTLNGLDCGSNVTIENCRFTRLTCRGGNASLIGVTAASEDAMLELWDTDAKIDADCTMDVLSATLSELGKGSMNIVNDGDVADRLDLTTRGGTIKLSGEGHARRLSLLDTSSYYKTKAAFKVEQDTDRLEIDVDSKTNVIYTGDVSGDIRIEDLKEGSSITLIGTVGGEVTVSFNADALGFEADGKTVEKYANACLKGLKLNKCKTAQNETPTVRLSEYYLMQISTNERSEDNLTNTVNIVDYDISYDGEKIVCSGRTHTTQRRERRGENDEWGDPVSETVVRYDAEGNVVD